MNSKNTTVKRIMSISIVVLTLFIGLNAKAQGGCMMVPLPLEERVQQSTVIVEGKVVSQESFWGIGRRNIFTRNTVLVYKVFKGNAVSGTIEVITEGGKVGETAQVYSATLTLQVGDMGILTCIPNPFKESGATGFTPYGSMQGFIGYSTDGTAHDPFKVYKNIEQDLYQSISRAANRPVQKVAANPYFESLRRNESNPNNIQALPTISGFSPTSISAGTGVNLTITGTNFGASQGTTGYVEFRNANDGGSTWVRPLTTDYVSWSDTQIVVKVPTVSLSSGPPAGTGQIRVGNSDPNVATSAATLTVTYAYSNYPDANYARMPSHITDNAFGGYTFLMNQSTFASIPGAVTKFRSVLNTWTCISGMNWLIGGNTTLVAGSDGSNVATFASIPAGTLARCISYYNACGSGATSNYFVAELDVEVNTLYTWYYGASTTVPADQFDFETVMLHEMGHGHQLNHVIDPTAVMHYSINSASAKRTINANEIAGATFIKNRDISIGTVCGQPQMTLLACNSATAAPIVTFTANRTNFVAGCSDVTFTAEAAPEVTSWSWNFGGGAPVSTSQNPTVSFTTAGTYTVALTATNAAGSTTFTRTSYITVTAPICSATNTNFVGTVADYNFSGGGKLAGHNALGDLAFADKFIYCGVATKLTQLKYYFNTRTGTGNITAKVWNADGAGGTPGTVLYSQTLAISALQAYPAATTFTLPTALSLTSDYYIGYQITYAGTDAVSLVTNSLGESTVNSAWRLSSTNAWATFQGTYGSTLSLKVEGVINNTPTATITPATATTFCSGGSVILNANTGAGYTYLWLKGGVTTGITTASYTATTTGSYTVQVSYGTCTTTSAATTVTVNNCNNADLSNLVSTTGPLTPVFASATTAYTISVASTTSTMNVIPTASDSAAPIKVNGVTVVSGNASLSLPLNIGSNTISTVVTAQDGTTTKTYTITVTRAAPASTNANLSNLVPNAGTLAPVFASATIAYTMTVPFTTTAMTVTPTVADATATVKVNTVTVASGNPSGSIALAVGANTITTIVTAQDGSTTKTYTITVTRTAASANANLSNLVPSTGTLAPVFAAATIAYTISVPNATTAMTVTPTVADATATVKVNTVTVTSGSPSGSIALAVGSNTITTVVTAQDGTTTKTYTITVTRAGSNNANLSNLVANSGTLTPAFAAATIAYTIAVPNTTTSMTVTPTVADATATIKVNTITVANGSSSGAIALNVGSNIITTVVTAQDGTTTKTYTITVTRAASNNANLSNLAVNSGTLSPIFAATTIAYTVSVPNTTISMTVTPTVADVTATIKVNTVTVANGSPSGAIALNVGSNIITTVVTAQDGTTTKTYTITVTRAASNNPNLSNLVVNSGTLSPVFAAATVAYTVSVPNTTTSMTVTPTVADATATIKVNTVTVASGSASGAIALSVGSNTITTVVTAQDGTTTKTYTITVTRASTGSSSIVNLKLLVQGYYLNGGLMKSVKLNQDGVSASDLVENLTVELHHATTYALIATTTATLKTNGTAVCTFTTAPSGSFYIAVKGSNIIQTWSALPQVVGNTPLTYDFTTSAAKAYSSNMLQLENNVWGFYNGDINHDDSIDLSDYALWEADSNTFNFGVLPTDLSGDGSVDLSDYSIWEGNANNFIFAIYPF